ncbi:chemoreceptor glutamine deamidase CheD [Comamonas flocculans]|uniref:Probable chemoreceptor glutamine deamidase CheD n=1 Tax=Comamonas flocculans TaxID=2597701 RepID=A0A5B8RUY4_9BURK|nr:chemoreceptor glutamine deamidase CheD [Comamonas flocculans]QEA12552.1 chemoreceptor glutamine deamidase CheD [Comamonas flocculans]
MSASDAAPAGVERRRAPRIGAATPEPARAPARTPSLDELKNAPRRSGEAAFFFFDQRFQFNAVKVLPGEYFVSNENLVIQTVLGSCIAACLWDSRSRVGGLNHFMLPEGSGADQSGRYGSYAMELLINEMMKLGARRETLQAKIFGGGQVMANFTALNVGERNTAFVQNYLATERIPIIAEDVLDIYPRKVAFFPATGKAMVKRLAHAHPDLLLAERTQGSAAAVVRAHHGGSVDLF